MLAVCVFPLVTAHIGIQEEAINFSWVMRCTEVRRSYGEEMGKCYKGRERVEG